jgi:hypothetical protein
MIRQLTYLSIPTDSLTERDAERIAAAAEVANRDAGITGMMAFGGGLLFQVLEGPRDTVEALVQRVRRDSRHRSMQVLTDEMIPSRDFDGFGMSFRTLDEEAVETIGATALIDETAIPEIVAAMSMPLAPRIPARAKLTLVHVAA